MYGNGRGRNTVFSKRGWGVMPPTPAPPSSHKTRYPLSSVPKAGIVVCMVVVAVAVFLGASFLASC